MANSAVNGTRSRNCRDFLPGISRRFNPQEATTIYKELVDAENEYYNLERSRHASYVTVGEFIPTVLPPVGSPNSSKPRSRSYGRIITKQEESRNVGLPDWKHHATQNRDHMRENLQKQDWPVSDIAQKRLIDLRMKKCASFVELSRETAKKHGTSSAHGGYDWPKYRYFSSGFNNPSSGTIDRLLVTDARFALVR